MAIEIHVWKLKGLTPLLQNNPATILAGNSDGVSAGKKKYNDVEEAAVRVYKDEEGFYHPSDAIRSALLTACTGRKIARKSAKSIIAGAVFPAETKMVLLNEKGHPIKDYTMHKCRAIVNKQGILRVRPMFEKWAITLPLEIDTDFVGPDIVTELLNIAGRIVGIGDMRPDTSKGKNGIGRYGRFTAELVK